MDAFLFWFFTPQKVTNYVGAVWRPEILWQDGCCHVPKQKEIPMVFPPHNHGFDHSKCMPNICNQKGCWRCYTSSSLVISALGCWLQCLLKKNLGKVHFRGSCDEISKEKRTARGYEPLPRNNGKWRVQLLWNVIILLVTAGKGDNPTSMWLRYLSSLQPEFSLLKKVAKKPENLSKLQPCHPENHEDQDCHIYMKPQLWGSTFSWSLSFFTVQGVESLARPLANPREACVLDRLPSQRSPHTMIPTQDEHANGWDILGQQWNW